MEHDVSSLVFRCDLAQVSHCESGAQCFLDNKHVLHLYMFMKVTDEPEAGWDKTIQACES